MSPTGDTIARKKPAAAPATLLDLVTHVLDEGKAEDLVTIDLGGKSSLTDHLVIASGRSTRQVSALAEQLVSKLKDAGYGRVPVEGKTHGDWVLIDAGDVIVHLFRPEVRAYYNLEKMWGASAPQTAALVEVAPIPA
jgi:ribosome-associated protein